jgi:hypothetical protein
LQYVLCLQISDQNKTVGTKKVFTKPSHHKEARLIPIQLLEQNPDETKPRKNNNPKGRRKKQERKKGTGR